VATCSGQNQITEETDVYQIFVGALIQLKAMSVIEAVNLGMDVSIPPTKSIFVYTYYRCLFVRNRYIFVILWILFCTGRMGLWYLTPLSIMFLYCNNRIKLNIHVF
jgi:hypothetical protein